MTKPLTKSQYQFYKEKGMPDAQVMKLHGLNNASFYAWKDKNNLKGVKFEKDLKETFGVSENAENSNETTPVSDDYEKQEPTQPKLTEQRITNPVDDEKDVRIKELEWRVKELQEKNELVIEERNAAREFLRQEREKSKEIIEDQADEIEGLKAEIADLRSQPNHAQLKGDMLTNLMKLYLQEVEG